MKYTLLQLTQNILSALDSDEVSSIADTTESNQVAEIVRTAYFNVVSRANLPEHQKPFSLVASGATDQPVLMSKPDNVRRIDWIKYNVSTTSEDDLEYVTILPLQQFLDMTQRLRTTDADVDSMTFDSLKFYYKTKERPQHCTIIKDYYIIFDSYDSSVDTTLQSSKTWCFGQIVPTFTVTDSFVPDLDDQQFPLLLNEAKALAFLELKQIAHDQAVRETKRQWNNLQKSKSLSYPSDFDQLPNYGRK